MRGFRLVRTVAGRSPTLTRDRRVMLQCQQLEERIVFDDNSVGPNGINAIALRDLGLNGAGVNIGQVEPFRPGLRSSGPMDKDSNSHLDKDSNSHPHVIPEKVFLLAGDPVRDENIDPHSIGVAGVMIADGPANKGVAPQAALYSSGTGNSPVQNLWFQNGLLSMQHVATAPINGADVPAINMSWGIAIPGAALRACPKT